MRADGKRSLLYRIFFKDPVGKQNAAKDGGDFLTELAQQAPRKSITLAITNEGVKTYKEMTEFPFMIGREYSEGGLQLDNKSVSRRHAVVDMRSYGVTITDENSSNGVKVSGKRLYPGEKCVLKCGDDINIGSVLVSVMDISDSTELASNMGSAEQGDRTQLLFPQQTQAPGQVPASEAVSPIAYDPPPVRTPAPAYSPTPVRPPAPAYSPPPVRPPAPAYSPPAPAPAAARPTTFCIQCGHPNSTEGSYFCIKCGSKLIK